MQSRRNGGFTLLELLLALGLTAMLLGLLSSGVFLVAEDWNRNSDQLDQNLDQSLAILQVERSLLGAFPHSYTDNDTLARLVYFVGEEDSLSWVSSVSPQRSPGLTAWALNNADEGVTLRLAPAYADDPRERLELATPVLLLPGYSASFLYLYDELDESRQWREDWSGEELQVLPLAVYLRLTPLDDDAGRVQELELVARILANQHRSLRPNELRVSQ